MNTEAVLEYDNWKQGAIRRGGIPLRRDSGEE
jgi:hypothetical protein